MSQVFGFILIACALIGSIYPLRSFIYGYQRDHIDYSPLKIPVYIGWLAVVAIIPMQIGGIAQGITSPSPFKEFSREFQEHGFFDGVGSFAISVVFLAWAFIVPGHMYADEKTLNGSKRLVHPYVINFLIGVVFCIRDNPFYHLIKDIFFE